MCVFVHGVLVCMFWPSCRITITDRGVHAAPQCASVSHAEGACCKKLMGLPVLCTFTSGEREREETDFPLNCTRLIALAPFRAHGVLGLLPLFAFSSSIASLATAPPAGLKLWAIDPGGRAREREREKRRMNVGEHMEERRKRKEKGKENAFAPSLSLSLLKTHQRRR